jgi:rod shape-determining protein MreB
MAMFSRNIGIDLGTNNTRAAEGSQLILDEPTVAAIIIAEQKMVSWGKEAQDMLGRVPDTIEVTRPLRNGVIADYEVAEFILRDILR